jgi:hypothetical protein
MFNDQNYQFNKMAWRNKARLNVCIAKDLAENYGGTKSDYLKRLNRKLKMKIAADGFYFNHFAKAA